MQGRVFIIRVACASRNGSEVSSNLLEKGCFFIKKIQTEIQYCRYDQPLELAKGTSTIPPSRVRDRMQASRIEQSAIAIAPKKTIVRTINK